MPPQYSGRGGGLLFSELSTPHPKHDFEENFVRSRIQTNGFFVNISCGKLRALEIIGMFSYGESSVYLVLEFVLRFSSTSYPLCPHTYNMYPTEYFGSRVFAENFGCVRFLVVCFLYKSNPKSTKNHLLWGKSGPKCHF